MMELVYVVCGNIDEARAISNYLVENKLAGCVNIIPGMESVYRWEGKVEHASEIVLLIKINAGMFKQIEAEVLKLHSYDCPAILKIDVSNVHQPYLDWLNEQVK